MTYPDTLMGCLDRWPMVDGRWLPWWLSAETWLPWCQTAGLRSRQAGALRNGARATLYAHVLPNRKHPGHDPANSPRTHAAPSCLSLDSWTGCGARLAAINLRADPHHPCPLSAPPARANSARSGHPTPLRADLPVR